MKQQKQWTAKDLHVAPISSDAAHALVKKIHYSGKAVRNSQLHLGVFLGGRLEGVMQFGPSLDKRKTMGLVSGTNWNDFLELNRMAFSETLPRNSESRALGVAFRMIRKKYPHIEWVVSFADATQCGDGTIYRAAGFVLTGINKNKTLWEINGQQFTDVGYRTGTGIRQIVSKLTMTSNRQIRGGDGSASMKHLIAAGARPLPGWQLRYVYFLNPEARGRLAVPEIPFSKIDELGARMYKGKRPGPKKSGGSNPVDAPGDQPGEAGSTPSPPLQISL